MMPGKTAPRAVFAAMPKEGPVGFLEALRKVFGGSGSGPEANVYWVYARCGRCGEPLRGRSHLLNEPSRAEDGETWVVRKGLMGSGAQRCFQMVEVTLWFDARKQNVINSEVSGGKVITEEEYEKLTSNE